jgi:hypothetical protein
MLTKKKRSTVFFTKLFELVAVVWGRRTKQNLELDDRQVFLRRKAWSLDNFESQQKLGIKLRCKKSGVAQEGIK